MCGVKHRHTAIAVLLTVWVTAIGYGLRVLWRYSNLPGSQAAASDLWPWDAPIQPAKERWTLLMFTHPQCPCSRAGIGELAWMLTRAGGNVDTRIFFYVPAGEPGDWAKTDLWRSASALPGVATMVDYEGAMAARFGSRRPARSAVRGKSSSRAAG